MNSIFGRSKGRNRAPTNEDGRYGNGEAGPSSASYGTAEVIGSATPPARHSNFSNVPPASRGLSYVSSSSEVCYGRCTDAHHAHTRSFRPIRTPARARRIARAAVEPARKTLVQRACKRRPRPRSIVATCRALLQGRKVRAPTRRRLRTMRICCPMAEEQQGLKQPRAPRATRRARRRATRAHAQRTLALRSTATFCIA